MTSSLPTTPGARLRIAVVGSGIAGLTTAHLLDPHHDVTVFEADDRVGGHTNTVDVVLESPSGATERHRVDTGFIVFNDRNYPNFTTLLDRLGVESQPSVMSFSVSSAATGLEYRGTNPNSIFAQRRNLLRPTFVRMLVDIVRFNRLARASLSGDAVDEGPTLRQFLAARRFSARFRDEFLVPLGSSIWSADPTTFLDFPLCSYARFMENHGLLAVRGMPKWRTVRGGSRTYVDALVARLSRPVRTSTPVVDVTRRDDPTRPFGVDILVRTTSTLDSFDAVVLAGHSDQSLRLLADATDAERSILSAICFQPNRATLHTDERFLPKSPRARASWNYHITAGDSRLATLTYWMNLLQSIESSRPLLVTLNRSEEIDPDLVIAEFDYAHPVFDSRALAAQRRRDEIQGRRGTFFAGAWWGYGFHEDGVVSALDVTRRFGLSL